MKARSIPIVRIGFAVLSLTAILVQLDRHASLGFSTVNFFSYFTNLSNMFFAVFLLTSAATGLLGKKPSPLMDAVRGASVLCMIVVGVVFSLLLRNEDLGTLLPWVNLVLHYLMPVVAVADWLLVSPKIKVTRMHIFAWLVFPLAYLAYSLIRGHARNWYPYPFLNPSKVGGYAGVTLYAIGICVLFVLGGLLVMYLANRSMKPAKT